MFFQMFQPLLLKIHSLDVLCFTFLPEVVEPAALYLPWLSCGLLVSLVLPITVYTYTEELVGTLLHFFQLIPQPANGLKYLRL